MRSQATCPELSSLGYWYKPEHRAGKRCPVCDGALYEQVTLGGTNAMMGCRNWRNRSGSAQCHFRSHHLPLKRGFKCGSWSCQVHHNYASEAFMSGVRSFSASSPVDYSEVWADDSIPGGLLPEPELLSRSRGRASKKRHYMPASTNSVHCFGSASGLSRIFREGHVQSSAPPLKKFKGRMKRVSPDG